MQEEKGKIERRGDHIVLIGRNGNILQRAELNTLKMGSPTLYYRAVKLGLLKAKGGKDNGNCSRIRSIS